MRDKCNTKLGHKPQPRVIIMIIHDNNYWSNVWPPFYPSRNENSRNLTGGKIINLPSNYRTRGQTVWNAFPFKVSFGSGVEFGVIVSSWESPGVMSWSPPPRCRRIGYISENDGTMLGQLLRSWSSIVPTLLSRHKKINVGLMLVQRRRR